MLLIKLGYGHILHPSNLSVIRFFIFSSLFYLFVFDYLFLLSSSNCISLFLYLSLVVVVVKVASKPKNLQSQRVLMTLTIIVEAMTMMTMRALAWILGMEVIMGVELRYTAYNSSFLYLLVTLPILIFCKYDYSLWIIQI